jgi:uncharacterized membrane protein YczE
VLHRKPSKHFVYWVFLFIGATMPSKREIGTVGAPLSGGYNMGEWNTRLAAQQPHLVYREIVDNDPVVGAVLFVIGYMLSNQTW